MPIATRVTPRRLSEILRGKSRESKEKAGLCDCYIFDKDLSKRVLDVEATVAESSGWNQEKVKQYAISKGIPYSVGGNVYEPL